MSRPSKKTLPDVDSKSPVRQLKNVDLPAPLGPIRPRMSPCSMVTDAVSTALKLPNAFVTSRASRSMAWFRGNRMRGHFAPLRPKPFDQSQDAARLKTRDENDDGAIQHESQSRAFAAEQVVGDFLQWNQYRRTYQGTEQQPRAAKRGHDQYLDGDQDAQAGLRIDKTEHHRVERARNAGEAGAEHERVELGAARRRAEGAGRPFGIPDRAEVESHPAIRHPPGDSEREREHGQEQVVVRQRRDEREVEDISGHSGAAQSEI